MNASHKARKLERRALAKERIEARREKEREFKRGLQQLERRFSARRGDGA